MRKGFWREVLAALARRDGIRASRGPIYFCATCCAEEGEQHAEWCHRDGVMTTRPLSSGSEADRG